MLNPLIPPLWCLHRVTVQCSCTFACVCVLLYTPVCIKHLYEIHVKYIKVVQLISKCFILFLLQIHTHTRAWCLCLCCHGDATCSLFHWSSREKGENAILHPSFSSSRTADWGISGFFVSRLIFLSFSSTFLPFYPRIIYGHLWILSSALTATEENIGISFIYILDQLCTSFPALTVFYWGNRSIGHIRLSQQELNFPSSTSRWA